MPALGLGPIAEFHAVDPGDHMRRIAHDSGAQFVPFSVPPKPGPSLWENWQRRGDRGNDLFYFSRRTLEFEVVCVRLAADPFAIDAHEMPARMIINSCLPGSAILSAAQKKAAVGAKVILHLERDFEITKLLIGNRNPAIAWNILRSDHHALLDDPAAP